MSDTTETNDDDTFDDASTAVTTSDSSSPVPPSPSPVPSPQPQPQPPPPPSSSYDGRTTDEDAQRRVLSLVKTCNVPSVKALLDEYGAGFDLNCKNYQGMTGLNLAIEANCEQMVDLLLSRPGLDIGDSLMHAIRENAYAIVIKLLDILQTDRPETVQLGYERSTEFPQYLTPLMLAAQCGHFTIISLLLKRGHTIQIPHKPQCLCKEASGLYSRGT